MEREIYVEDNHPLLKFVDANKDSAVIGASFRQVGVTLAQIISLGIELEEMGLIGEDKKVDLSRDLQALENYKRLIEGNSRYREAEFNTCEGYFPNVEKIGDHGARNYVEESVRRLIR